ncbi:MAG: hemin uptake protein HemP [Burkholderiaceae bacterium]
MTHDLPDPSAAPAESAAGPAVPAGAAPRLPAPTVKITSEKLFAGAREVQIDHHGALYRLKKTSLGKLILTK